MLNKIKSFLTSYFFLIPLMAILWGGLIFYIIEPEKIDALFFDSAENVVSVEETSSSPDPIDNGNTTEEVINPIVLPNEDEVFMRFSTDNWQADIDEAILTEMVNDLVLIIGYDLGLDMENLPRVRFVYKSDVTWMGICYYQTNLIEINFYYIFRNKTPNYEIIDTLAHEMRHTFQFKRISENKDTALEYSLSNYITPEDDRSGYYNQLCEQDARLYGEFFLNYVKQRISTIENMEEKK